MAQKVLLDRPLRGLNRAQVKRELRLTRSSDFERVRRSGKSYAHPLVVLIAAPNQQKTTRIGVAAGKSVGNAVKRNRAKRLIRAALVPLQGEIATGWDLVFLARRPMTNATIQQTGTALRQILNRAKLLIKMPSPHPQQKNE
jgi:ribonuclease P protein component